MQNIREWNELAFKARKEVANPRSPYWLGMAAGNRIA